MLNEKDKEFYENHAKELTEKYLKDHSDLKFVPVFSTDESGIPTITMKLVKKEENTKVLNEIAKNVVEFDLSLPPLVHDKAEFYLSLIDFLVEELRKYVDVKIYNEYILEQWKQKVEEQRKRLDEEILEQYKQIKEPKI